VRLDSGEIVNAALERLENDSRPSGRRSRGPAVRNGMDDALRVIERLASA
jgi:hypothetical protein